MKHRSSAIAVLLLAAACIVAAPARATLIDNGDFAAGFDGWTGQVGDLFSSPVLSDVPVLPGAFGSNFDASSDTAVLQTTGAGVGWYDVILNQNLDLTTQSAGTALKLSFDLLALDIPDISLGGGDFGGALRYGCNADRTMCSDIIIFLTNSGAVANGIMADLSAAAGSLAQLTFSVSTFTDSAEASMTIDNVSLTAVPTPAPATFVLVALGLLIGRMRARTRPIV